MGRGARVVILGHFCGIMDAALAQDIVTPTMYVQSVTIQHPVQILEKQKTSFFTVKIFIPRIIQERRPIRTPPVRL